MDGGSGGEDEGAGKAESDEDVDMEGVDDEMDT
jgi:hypothetical protein